MKNIVVFTLLFPFLMFSQNFSGEDFIYLKRHEHIDIKLNKGNFDITKSFSEQGKFLTANKLYFANESIGFDGFSAIEDIKAYTYLPEENKKIEVDYIETKRAFDNGIFYSDQESKTFTFPAVKAGAEIHLEYKEIVKDPRFLGLFRFGTFVPTESTKLSIEFPKNVSIGYIDFNTQDYPINFKEEIKGNNKTYTWTVNNMKGFQGEAQSESVLYYLPHIILYIKNYEDNGKTNNILNDVNDLYQWYSTLVDSIDENNLEKVHAVAKDITKSISSKREKAEAIFNWVQDNITYVAFEDGLGGFIPRSASSVCDKRYGDCKDMANLLYEMLNHVGIESYRTWIGTRDRPYSYWEVPTPIVDNHMINTVIIENDTIFLDATDSYVPFGMPSAFTQTKEALLGIDKDSFKVIKVPVQDMDKSVSEIHSIITLEDDLVKVDETRSLTGYEKVDFISDYTYKKGDKTEEEYLNTTLAIGNNKTNYINITKTNFDNKNTPLVLKYNLNIDSYAKSVANKTFINLDIDRTLSQSKIDIEDRKFSKKIDHKFKKKFVTTFKIPEGYRSIDIPEELVYDNEKFGFKISYSKEGNVITQHKLIYVNTLSVDNSEFETWNDFIQSLTRAYKKSITIERI
ncbi:MAG: DUF3857 domain-containing protein [Flavobacteriaceae bacterium]|nr:DUF3857 domain-containing protein [Flavobacteriaceae bacterium]